MKRLSHVHRHTLDLDLRELNREGDWTGLHVLRSGFMAATAVKEKDTISYTNLSKANQDRHPTERQIFVSRFEWLETGKDAPCP